MMSMKPQKNCVAMPAQAAARYCIPARSFMRNIDRSVFIRAAPAGLPPDCTVLQRAEGLLALSVPAARSAAVLTALASQLALTDVQVEARPIDEVIAALYRDLRI